MNNYNFVSYFPQKRSKRAVNGNGRWTKTQHDRFMKALQKYGRDWVTVQQFVKTRTLSQVRSHAQKVFMKMSQEDIEALIAGQGNSDLQNSTHIAISKNSQNKRKPKDRYQIIQQKIKPDIEHKQSLLDIFKRAIQMQTLQLNNKHIQNQNPLKPEPKTILSQSPKIPQIPGQHPQKLIDMSHNYDENSETQLNSRTVLKNIIQNKQNVKVLSSKQQNRANKLAVPQLQALLVNFQQQIN